MEADRQDVDGDPAGSPNSRTAQLARAWPHVRAVLILLHIAAILTMCSPARHRLMVDNHWQGAESDAIYDSWAKRMNSVGFNTSRDGLRTFWRNRIENYLSVREALATIAARYTNPLHLGQGWSLFSSPKRNPALLVVDIHHPITGWRPLYRQRSEHRWRARMFDNHRMRKLVGRFAKKGKSGKKTGLYYPVANWLARMAAKDFPEADKLRTRLWRYQTKPPGVTFDPADGSFTHERVIRLELYR